MTWIESGVFRALLDLQRQNKKCDVLVADPPRRGLAEALESLLALKPGRVIYVSCDASSFARDAHGLIRAGYLLKQVQPLDMFPHTAHVEMVGLFTASDQ